MVLEIENPRDYVMQISFSLPKRSDVEKPIEPKANTSGDDDDDGEDDGEDAKPPPSDQAEGDDEAVLEQAVEVVVPYNPIPVPQYEPVRTAEAEVTFEDDPPCVVERSVTGAVRVALPLRINKEDGVAAAVAAAAAGDGDGDAGASVSTVVNVHFQHHVMQLKARTQVCIHFGVKCVCVCVCDGRG